MVYYYGDAERKPNTFCFSLKYLTFNFLIMDACLTRWVEFYLNCMSNLLSRILSNFKYMDAILQQAILDLIIRLRRSHVTS